MSAEKKVLRVKMKAYLNSLSNEKIAKMSDEMTKSFRQWFEVHAKGQRTQIVGAYAPLFGEPVLSLKMLGQLSLAFPRVLTPTQLSFHLCRPEDLVCQQVGSFVLNVPPAHAPEVSPDLLLIPALAFDRQGYRLGRGKGFYDRYLEGHQVKAMGVCFMDQVLETVFAQEHDQPVDWLLTESGVTATQRGD